MQCECCSFEVSEERRGTGYVAARGVCVPCVPQPRVERAQLCGQLIYIANDPTILITRSSFTLTCERCMQACQRAGRQARGWAAHQPTDKLTATGRAWGGLSLKFSRVSHCGPTSGMLLKSNVIRKCNSVAFLLSITECLNNDHPGMHDAIRKH